MTQLVSVKEFKVAYWEDGKTMKGKMFNTLIEAQSFIETLPSSTIYTLMRGKNIEGEDSFSWTVLSNGVGKFLPGMSFAYRHKGVIGLTLGASLIYAVFRKR